MDSSTTAVPLYEVAQRWLLDVEKTFLTSDCCSRARPRTLGNMSALWTGKTGFTKLDRLEEVGKERGVVKSLEGLLYWKVCSCFSDTDEDQTIFIDILFRNHISGSRPPSNKERCHHGETELILGCAEMMCVATVTQNHKKKNIANALNIFDYEWEWCTNRLLIDMEHCQSWLRHMIRFNE